MFGSVNDQRSITHPWRSDRIQPPETGHAQAVPPSPTSITLMYGAHRRGYATADRPTVCGLATCVTPGRHLEASPDFRGHHEHEHLRPPSGRTSSAGSRQPAAIKRSAWWVSRCSRTWITRSCRTAPDPPATSVLSIRPRVPMNPARFTTHRSTSSVAARGSGNQTSTCADVCLVRQPEPP